jgi:hypothetical protein
MSGKGLQAHGADILAGMGTLEPIGNQPFGE